MRIIILISFSLGLLLISAACDAGGNGGVGGGGTEPAASERASGSPQETAIEATSSAESGQSFFAEAGLYDGQAVKSISLGGEMTETRFVRERFLPFGLYIPDELEINDLPDRRQWWLDIYSTIDLLEPSTPLPAMEREAGLSRYAEYEGSASYAREGRAPGRADYFRYAIEDREVLIAIRYDPHDKRNTGARFRDIVKHIRYTGELASEFQAEQDRRAFFLQTASFDGQREKRLEIGGQMTDTVFAEAKFLPFGLYIPGYVTPKEQEDGRYFALDARSEIHLLPGERDPTTLEMKPELGVYKEYIGSEFYKGEGGIEVHEDFFLYRYNGESTRVSLRYFLPDRENVVPRMMDIARTVAYLERSGE